MTAVVCEALTQDAIAGFGHLIEATPAKAFEINDGWTERHHALATVDVEGADAIVSMFRGRARPLVATMLERHPFGTQAFVPLGGRPWVAVFAEAPDAPLRAFLCRGDQGVQIARNVWHHPLLTLETQDFLVIDRARPEENVEVVTLSPALPVTP